MLELLARFRRWTWLAAYDLESARQAYAARRCYLRSAACCVALAALMGLRGSA